MAAAAVAGGGAGGVDWLCEFLEACIHMILYTRGVYPPGPSVGRSANGGMGRLRACKYTRLPGLPARAAAASLV